MNRTITGCTSLDNLLGGGLEKGSVTLLYGEGGTGKTNICLLAAYTLAKQGVKVAYVDTEGLSYERIDQIFTDKETVKNLLVYQVHNFEEQCDRIPKVCKLSNVNDQVGLIIVDSVNCFYRLHTDDTAYRSEFNKQTEMLHETARINDIPILLTSQVYANILSGTIEFIGGHALHHNAKTIVRLDKKGNGKRTAVIVKHRSLPEGRFANYHITETGIESD